MKEPERRVLAIADRALASTETNLERVNREAWDALREIRRTLLKQGEA